MQKKQMQTDKELTNEIVPEEKTPGQKIWQTVKKLAHRWFIVAMGGMAMGLFATLIAGTIMQQIANLLPDGGFTRLLLEASRIARFLMGAGIGAGVAYALKADRLTMFAAIVAGMLGAIAPGNISNGFLAGLLAEGQTLAFGIGNPIGAFLAALFAVEVCLLLAGKTKLDLIVLPLASLIVAVLVTLFICPSITWLIEQIARGLFVAVGWNAFIMGIIIAASIGLILTLPPSSAAIWITICSLAPAGQFTDEIALASAAAAAGGAAHMIGFAVASFRENKWGGLIAQGLGTSMLQIPNVMKKPVILLPAIAASIIVGPLATTVFQLRGNAVGGGMGTAGLVGVIQTVAESAGQIPAWQLVLGVALLFFIIPAGIALLVSEILRKYNIIKLGDMKLEL
jgi:hypothetical protein